MKDKKRGDRRWRTFKIHRRRLKEFYDTYHQGVFFSPTDPHYSIRGDGMYSETPCWCSCQCCSKRYSPPKKQWVIADYWEEEYSDEVLPEEPKSEWDEDMDEWYNRVIYPQEYGYW